MKEIRVKTANLETNGNFWVLDGQPYSGPYHTWTDGKAMTESTFENGISEELVPSIHARNIVSYDGLTERKNRGGKYAEQERNRPKKSDYKKGSFTRYFVRKSSDKTATIFETKPTTLSKLKKGYYDNISMLWKLTGPALDELDSNGNIIKSGVKSTNARTIKKKNVQMKGLSWRLSDHLEYWIPGRNK